MTAGQTAIPLRAESESITLPLQDGHIVFLRNDLVNNDGGLKSLVYAKFIINGNTFDVIATLEDDEQHVDYFDIFDGDGECVNESNPLYVEGINPDTFLMNFANTNTSFLR